MKKVILFLFICCCAFQMKGQTLPVLLTPSDAASAGIAETSLAADSYAFAIDVNPSSVMFSQKKMSAAFTYGKWAPAATNGNLLSAGGWFNGGHWSVGLGFKNLKMDGYEVTSNNGVISQIEDTFYPSDMLLSLGGAFKITQAFSMGATVRMVSSSLAKDAKYTGFNADLAATFSNNKLQAGVKLANLGPKVSYGEESSYPQPMLLSAGISYTIIKGFNANAQADFLFSGAFAAGIGAEYGWKDMLFVRAGYHLGTGKKGIGSYGSLGLGFHIVGISIDAAYIAFSETLRNTLMFTLSYSL